MFGGSLQEVWPFAAVALHYFDGFSGRFRKAVQTSEAVLTLLTKESSLEVERIPNGTNLSRLRLLKGRLEDFRKRLLQAGVVLSHPNGNTFTVGVNETWNRLPAAEIAARIRRALG